MVSPHIAVAAYSGRPSDSMVRGVRDFMDTLKGCVRDAVILLGGYYGLMRVVADEAKRTGFRLVFVVPYDREDQPYPSDSIVIRTGLGDRERSSILVRSGDVLVSFGGGVGTFLEVLIAYSYGIPVYQLVNNEDILTDRVSTCIPDGVLDERIGSRVYYAKTGKELAEKVCNGLRRRS